MFFVIFVSCVGCCCVTGEGVVDVEMAGALESGVMVDVNGWAELGSRGVWIVETSSGQLSLKDRV